MKRLTALLLALLLMLNAGAALAADRPIEEKFIRQVQESAYRASIAFEVSGSGSAVFGDTAWALLTALAPRITLEGDHSYSRGEGQATVSLKVDGQAAGKAVLLYNDTLAGISGDMLGGTGTYYTFARDWDLSQLLQGLIQGENAWPPVWRLILAAESAPEQWKTKAREAMVPYETKLGIWMSGFAAYSTGSEDNVNYTQLSCLIPAQAVKTEIKQLMVDFYNDASLLSLLREIATPREAAAYLQPGMMQSFFVALDSLPITGDIGVLRRYDANGNFLLDQISLPFAENQILSSLTISLTPDEGGSLWTVRARTQSGIDLEAACLMGEDMICTGSVLLMLPEEGEDQDFVVSDAAVPRKTIAFDYNFSWDGGEEKYTLSTDKFERSMRGTLLIKPKEGSGLPAQTLQLEAAFSSGSSQRSATQLNATLTWHDLESDSAITATLTSRTAAPFAIGSLDSVKDTALRVDLVADETRAAILQRWGQAASAWAQALIARLTVGAFVAGSAK